MKQHWMSAHSFRSGDRVIVNGEAGIIIDIFPDGIHIVKLDGGGKVIAVTARELRQAQAGSHAGLDQRRRLVG